MRYFFKFVLLALALHSSAFAQTSPSATAAGPRPEVALGVGDTLRITVFQNPDLTLEAVRISENGQINFPLIGNVAIGGLPIGSAEQKIAKMLRDGGFVLRI